MTRQMMMASGRQKPSIATLDWKVCCCWRMSESEVRQMSPPGMADMGWGRWSRRLGRDKLTDNTSGINNRMGDSHQDSYRCKGKSFK